MSQKRGSFVVVADSARLPVTLDVPVRSADEYLQGERETLSGDLVVINLCRSYQYLSKGYYVSLLAEARGHRVLPDLSVIEEIGNPYSYLRRLREAGVATIDYKVVEGRRRVVPKVIVPRDDTGNGERGAESPYVARPGGNGFRYEPTPAGFTLVTSVFGKTVDDRFRRFCSAIYRAYPVPLLKIRMYPDSPWQIGQIYPCSVQQLQPEELHLLSAELSARRFRVARRTQPELCRIACLWDPEDPYSPSDEDTLDRFERAASRRGAIFEVIGRNDLNVLAEYDALFIRTSTAIDHFSFAFAQRAASLDIPVIDDPQSTMRCSNKVFLFEMFRRNGLPMPRTITISRKWDPAEIEAIGYPVIVKQPDGTFSAAVKKADGADELRGIAGEMFRRSPLLVVQEYIPTAFDWRIGVLEGKVLFACRYFMVKGHWQIVGQSAAGSPRYGRTEAVRIEDVPEAVRTLAVDAAALIGNGLYGVDVKETPSGPVLIEINDNPDLWVGEEDGVEKDRIYDEIIGMLVRRIQEGLGAVGR